MFATATAIGETIAERQEKALCEILLRSGKLDAVTAARAVRAQDDAGEALPFVLTRLGLVSELDLVETMCEFSGLHRVGRSDFPDAPIAIDGLSELFLRSSRIVPVDQNESAVIVALANPCERIVRINGILFSNRQPGDTASGP
jgi:general secretion pathway protein E